MGQIPSHRSQPEDHEVGYQVMFQPARHHMRTSEQTWTRRAQV